MIKYIVSKIKYIVDLGGEGGGYREVEINAWWSCMLIKFPKLALMVQLRTPTLGIKATF